MAYEIMGTATEFPVAYGWFQGNGFPVEDQFPLAGIQWGYYFAGAAAATFMAGSCELGGDVYYGVFHFVHFGYVVDEFMVDGCYGFHELGLLTR